MRDNHASPGNPIMQLRRSNYGEKKDDRNRYGVVARYMMWCPGCEQAHGPEVRIPETPADYGGPLWDFDGNMEKPTFSPSLLCYSTTHLCPPEYEHRRVCPSPDGCGDRAHLVLSEEPRVLGHMEPHIVDPAWGNCHSFIQNGMWVFLGDCAHKLAGQTVPLPPLPDWLVRE